MPLGLHCLTTDTIDAPAQVRRVDVPLQFGSTKMSRGYAFVHFLDAQDAEAAIEALDGSTSDIGTTILVEKVKFSESQQDRVMPLLTPLLSRHPTPSRPRDADVSIASNT